MKEEKQIPAPSGLQELQEGMGQSIRTPISFQSGKFKFQKETYPADTVKLILSRGSQSGAERLAIYNEQYWYRLFTILQQEFPLLANYLGFWEFNQLASRYLNQHPSRHPTLDYLSSKFEEWFLEKEDPRSRLMEQIIRLEAAFHKAFHAPNTKVLEAENFLGSDAQIGEESVLEFQSAFSLYEEDWNLMDERIRLHHAKDAISKGIASAEEMNSDFRIKPQPKKGYWAIYRRWGISECLELDALAFQLLTHLKSGQSIGEACSQVAEDLTEEALGGLVQNLPAWFADWTARGWFLA